MTSTPRTTATPVVLLIFNRPQLTERVFAAIRNARPKTLLIVADGPRVDRKNDLDLVAAARDVVAEVDWPCEVRRNYSDINLGLRLRVSSGLDWVFGCVEEAIVLEDDCLPHPSFFRYCDTLLERYRHDSRVISISGDNYQYGTWRGDGSYYFSKYSTCWGWASWRRAWQLFDLSISAWPDLRDSGEFNLVCPDPIERAYWSEIFNWMHTGEVNSWAYAWVFAAFANHCLSAHPNHNLVSNIGEGPDATHTTGASRSLNLSTLDIGEIKHPRLVRQDVDADLVEFDGTHGGFHRRLRAEAEAGRIQRLLLRAMRFGRRVRREIRAAMQRRYRTTL